MDLTAAMCVHLDDDLLVLDKPPGLPVHATPDPGRDHLLAAAARWLAAQGLDAAGLGLAHRLDVGTSGLIVLGRRAEVTATLAAAFAGREIDKRYVALTPRRKSTGHLDAAGDAPLADATALPPDVLDVRNHLAANKDRKGVPVIAVRAGGDRAWTSLRVLAASERAILWSAQLHTGRRHQIRAHLAGLGWALVGDLDYDTALPASRPMLHAHALSLGHPRTGARLQFVAPLPADFLVVASRLGIEVESLAIPLA